MRIFYSLFLLSVLAVVVCVMYQTNNEIDPKQTQKLFLEYIQKGDYKNTVEQFGGNKCRCPKKGGWVTYLVYASAQEPNIAFLMGKPFDIGTAVNQPLKNAKQVGGFNLPWEIPEDSVIDVPISFDEKKYMPLFLPLDMAYGEDISLERFNQFLDNPNKNANPDKDAWVRFTLRLRPSLAQGTVARPESSKGIEYKPEEITQEELKGAPGSARDDDVAENGSEVSGSWEGIAPARDPEFIAQKQKLEASKPTALKNDGSQSGEREDGEPENGAPKSGAPKGVEKESGVPQSGPPKPMPTQQYQLPRVEQKSGAPKSGAQESGAPRSGASKGDASKSVAPPSDEQADVTTKTTNGGTPGLEITIKKLPKPSLVTVKKHKYDDTFIYAKQADEIIARFGEEGLRRCYYIPAEAGKVNMPDGSTMAIDEVERKMPRLKSCTLRLQIVRRGQLKRWTVSDVNVIDPVMKLENGTDLKLDLSPSTNQKNENSDTASGIGSEPE